jgi:hypothetical protein
VRASRTILVATWAEDIHLMGVSAVDMGRYKEGVGTSFGQIRDSCRHRVWRMSSILGFRGRCWVRYFFALGDSDERRGDNIHSKARPVFASYKLRQHAFSLLWSREFGHRLCLLII